MQALILVWPRRDRYTYRKVYEKHENVWRVTFDVFFHLFSKHFLRAVQCWQLVRVYKKVGPTIIFKDGLRFKTRPYSRRDFSAALKCQFTIEFNKFLYTYPINVPILHLHNEVIIESKIIIFNELTFLLFNIQR